MGLVFVAAGDKAYLSITGTARVVDDPELRAAAWQKNDGAFVCCDADDRGVDCRRAPQLPALGALADAW